MEARTPWRTLGVIGLRLVNVVVRYSITITITIAALELSRPADGSVDVKNDLELAAIIGIPSILITFVYELVTIRTGPGFRGVLAGFLLLPLWILLAFPPLLLFHVIGQLFFALCVMRIPLLSPPQLGRQETVSLFQRL